MSSDPTLAYLHEVTALLQRIHDEESESISRAAEAVAAQI
jgi:uncharacterized phosphosugar-binding protein